jgi:hypothetical protein
VDHLDAKNDAKLAALTHIYPTKKRGIIWLGASLLALCVAGYALFMAVIFIAIRVGKTIFSFFLHDFTNANSLYFLLASAGICFLAYCGFWYGITMIIASYKKYSFKKARILAVVLAVATLGLTYGLFAVFS